MCLVNGAASCNLAEPHTMQPPVINSKEHVSCASVRTDTDNGMLLYTTHM